MDRFFIIGNPRSGTTLLRLMLNKHSEIIVPPEAGFLVWLYKNLKVDYFNNGYKIFLEDLKATNKIESWNLNYNELEAYLNLKKPTDYKSAIDYVYKFYALKVLKKKVNIYGDKNNYYLNNIDLIAKLYKKARFIHIIRDGRSVAVSYKNVMKCPGESKYAPKLPTNITDIAIEWTNNIKCIEKSFSSLSDKNFFTLKYEDLVLEPEKQLCLICDFLNVKFEKGMLEYYKTTEKEGLEPQEYMAWKIKNLQPLQKKEINKYKQLSNEEIFNFNEVAKELLIKYRYL